MSTDSSNHSRTVWFPVAPAALACSIIAFAILFLSLRLRLFSFTPELDSMADIKLVNPALTLALYSSLVVGTPSSTPVEK